MAQVVSEVTGATATGRPRNSGRNCCSAEAKKELKSTNKLRNGMAQNYTYTVTLIDTNDPPSDLTTAWDFNTLITPLPANSLFCKLIVVDGRDGSGYTFTLVAGAGADDNALFTVNGATLSNVAVVDFTAAKSTFNVRLRADNGRPNGVIEKAVTITSPFPPPKV